MSQSTRHKIELVLTALGVAFRLLDPSAVGVWVLYGVAIIAFLESLFGFVVQPVVAGIKKRRTQKRLEKQSGN